MAVKLCYACEIEKDISEFSPKSSAKDKLQSSCKDCRRQKYREVKYCNNCGVVVFNSKTGLCYTCYQKEYNVRKRKKRREYKEQLTHFGCSCCGESHPDCLEVHHLYKGAKRFKNSRGQSSEYNLDDVSKGIAIVLCANCHSLFHAHFGGKAAHFPDQTKESAIEIIKLQRGLKGV